MMQNGDGKTTKERNKKVQTEEEHESENEEGYQNKHIDRQAYIYLS